MLECGNRRYNRGGVSEGFTVLDTILRLGVTDVYVSE